MKKKPAYKKIQKRKVDYWSIFFFLLIIAGLTYIIFDVTRPAPVENNKITYNGFEFTKENGIWTTQIQRDGQLYIIMTEFNPTEVEDVNITYNENLFPVLTQPGDTVYISFNPNETNKSAITVAAVDFAKGLNIVFRTNVEAACTINATGCEFVETCNTTNDGVIELIKEPEPRAVYKDNCLKVYGEGKDLIKVVNRILFEWYGIIKVDETGQVYRI